MFALSPIRKFFDVADILLRPDSWHLRDAFTSHGEPWHIWHLMQDMAFIVQLMKESVQLKKLLDGRKKELDYITPAPLVFPLHLTLEEIYNGGIKTIQQDGRMHANYGSAMMKTDQLIELKIVPGWTNGTKVMYRKMSATEMCQKDADLIFEIIVDEHPRFRLDNFDLHTTVKV